MRHLSTAILAVAFVICGVSSCPAEAPFLSSRELSHLKDALAEMDMTLTDLEFKKDVGEPDPAIQWIRDTLHDPLSFIERAEAVRTLGKDVGSDWLQTARQLIEVESSSSPAPAPGIVAEIPSSLSPELAATLNEYLPRLAGIDRRVKDALQVEREESEYVLASQWGGIFDVVSRREVRRALRADGVSRSVLNDVLAEEREIDPEPAARRLLAALEAIDLAGLIDAYADLLSLQEDLISSLRGVESWPKRRVSFDSEAGPIVIGTNGDDSYKKASALILDPGGDDTYLDAAASANGLNDRHIAVVLDMAGKDTYRSKGLAGPATSCFGISLLTDIEGDDSYLCEYTGSAAALCGVSMLDDRAGDDTHKAWAFAQGAAVRGVAMLRDGGGDDTYDVGLCGQAYAGLQGCALLVEVSGNDRYTAGGREPDHERHNDRYLSLAQGFAIGMRPFAGGGVAALLDVSGDDSYAADIYGQGVSYWYSAGMLIDEQGNDSYEMYHYGQGAGIHLSLGLLADRDGNDTYKGHSLAQGCAHDYAVGFLLEGGGNDVYSANDLSQGEGMNNACGILIDSGGDDSYEATHNELCQGVGNNGGEREYGSLGLLLNLSGADRYSSGAEDGARMLRPDYGIIYDSE